MADKVQATKDEENIVDQGPYDSEHPCAKCVEDDGPQEGCKEFHCSGCMKPEEYENRERKLCLPQSILEELYG
jgi:hypothetical protein